MRKTVEGDIGCEGTGSVDLTWGPLLEDVPTTSILERTMGAEGIIHI